MDEIGPVTRLRAVKRPSDARFTWTPDARANGYDVWYVSPKERIPDARVGSAAAVPGCIDTARLECDHRGAIDDRSEPVLFYNVLGVCDGVEAAR